MAARPWAVGDRQWWYPKASLKGRAWGGGPQSPRAWGGRGQTPPFGMGPKVCGGVRGQERPAAQTRRG